MDGLTLEIVEGPGSGRQIPVDRPVVIGRAPESDLVLEDGEVSRHHARVSPGAGTSAVVEDLGSANGTFINGNELFGPAPLDPGDELLLGVTLIQARTREQIASQTSVTRAVPPALLAVPRTPDYVDPAVIAAEAGGGPSRQGTPELDKYLDVRVRRRAQLAPLALLVLVAIALIIYFGLR